MKIKPQLWQQMGADIDAKRAARSQVRAYAKQHGIECARQQAPKPKRTHAKVTPDQRPGGCRSLTASEIAALGYQPSAKAPADKAPEPQRPTAKPREARSIEAWQRSRRLSGSWV